MKPSSLKLLYVLGTLDYGGVQVLATELFPRVRARGVDAEVLLLANGGPLAKVMAERGVRVSNLEHPGGPIYRLDTWISTAKKLHAYIRLHRPTIVHTHLYMPDVVARLVGHPGTTLVTTLHSVDPWWGEPDRLRSRAKTYLDGCLARWREVRLIAVSQGLASAAAAALRVSAARFRVIFNGVDPVRFPFRSYRSRPAAPRLIQIGRMEERKGHFVALAAFARILAEFPESKLAFAGDGPLRGQLEAEARASGLSDRVTFLGSRDDIPALLGDSDVFWMPSRCEGLPIAPLEAMACGLPTVTTNVPGLREVAVDGVTGLVVPPESPDALAEATLRILQDPILAARMGLAGRKRVIENFSIDKTADEYVRAYEDILSGRW